MRVKLADRLLDGKKLSKEGEEVLDSIKKGTLVMPDKTPISLVMASLYRGVHMLLLSVGYIEYNEKQEYPLKTLCEAFLKLGIFEKVEAENSSGVKKGHGPAAAVEVLDSLQEKLATPPKDITQEELLTKQTDIQEKKLEHIDKLLLDLAKNTGFVRAAIVEVGNAPENCGLVRFFAGRANVPAPMPIEARTIKSQCFNFHRTIVDMNKDIAEKSKAKKKHPIKRAILLTKSEDSKITFMLDIRKTQYVFMLETPISVIRGMIFLEMEKTMEEVLKLL